MNSALSGLTPFLRPPVDLPISPIDQQPTGNMSCRSVSDPQIATEDGFMLDALQRSHSASKHIAHPSLRSTQAPVVEQGLFSRPQSSGDPQQGFTYSPFVLPKMNVSRPAKQTKPNNEPLATSLDQNSPGDRLSDIRKVAPEPQIDEIAHSLHDFRRARSKEVDGSLEDEDEQPPAGNTHDDTGNVQRAGSRPPTEVLSHSSVPTPENCQEGRTLTPPSHEPAPNTPVGTTEQEYQMPEELTQRGELLGLGQTLSSCTKPVQPVLSKSHKKRATRPTFKKPLTAQLPSTEGPSATADVLETNNTVTEPQHSSGPNPVLDDVQKEKHNALQDIVPQSKANSEIAARERKSTLSPKRHVQRPQIKWTSLDIMKILGHKLDKEQRESNEAQTRFEQQETRINELKDTLQATHTDREKAQKALKLSEEVIREKNSRIKILQQSLRDLGISMEDAKCYQLQLGSQFDDLRAQSCFLKKECDENRSSLKNQVERAVSRAKELTQAYTNAQLEVSALAHSKTHIEGLQMQLKDMAGALAEERDRSSRLEHQVERKIDEQSDSLTKLTADARGNSDYLERILMEFKSAERNIDKLPDMFHQKCSSEQTGLKDNLHILEQLVQSISERIFGRFDALEKAQLESTSLESFQADMKLCFDGLKAHLSDTKDLDVRIDDLVHENSDLRSARDELKRAKESLEVKVLELEEGLRVAQENFIKVSNMSTRVQVKDSELSQTKALLENCHGDLSQCKAQLVFQGDEMLNLKLMNNTLETRLSVTQEELSTWRQKEIEHQEAAVLKEKTLRQDLKERADEREEQLRMEYEAKISSVNALHAKLQLDFEAFRSRCDSDISTMRTDKERLECQIDEMEVNARAFEWQSNVATDSLRVELEAAHVDIANRELKETSNEAKLVQLEQQLSEAHSVRTPNVHSVGTQTDVYTTVDIERARKFLNVDLVNAPGVSNVPASEKWKDRPDACNGTVVGQPDMVSGDGVGQSHGTPSLLGEYPIRKQLRRIDRNAPVPPRAHSMPASTVVEVEHEHGASQSPDLESPNLFEFVRMNAINEVDRSQDVLVPDTQMSPRHPSVAPSLHDSHLFSDLDSANNETSHVRTSTAGSGITADEQGTIGLQRKRNAPNSSSKMSQEPGPGNAPTMASQKKPIPHFHTPGSKQDSRLSAPNSLLSQGNGDNSSNPPSSPSLPKSHNAQARQLTIKFSASGSTNSGTSNQKAREPSQTLKRKATGPPETAVHAGKRLKKQASPPCKESDANIHGTPNSSASGAKGPRKSNKHERYNLRFKEVLGMSQQT